MIYEKGTIFYVELDNRWDEKYTPLISFINEEKRAKIWQYRLDIDRKISLFSDLLVRVLACKIINKANKDLKFMKTQYGKPYLLNQHNFYYNISHTRNRIVCAVYDDEIGIDIEKVRQYEKKIAQRFFSINELDYIESDIYNQDNHFFSIWTKKEAYIKWIGKGLKIPLESFDVLEDPISSMVNTFQLNDYIISVCTRISPGSFKVHKLSEQQVYEMALIIIEEF